MNRPTNMVRANEEVVGADVKNLGNEDLGEIIEVMLDKRSGQVTYVVLDCGSFLGVGGKYFALPWNALHYDANDECFKVDLSKKKLESSTGFDKDNWPNTAINPTELH